ncbi:UbiX family flavin prenyltransferase [Leptospira yasudae]|uniref:Flavin prenyltransferase UbiX n=1 Tax=Leptospira yasudae TaxID=2202201 RepID=A0ABX9M0K5_9LEPT|nr:UbiX family flavin prenyltransferase [Leptospira yasudae]MBW0434892.1 UbiX family flavin prenyltransferase [Leptospira yasudae]RHX78911.1 3-octaprenyl-4-hydroxybenzoate carboxy-lyase [Leptospira yasudae]TGK23548.1 UbiX family flavin prenyltransferase [Leptospira yasudae]TGM09137.1 UbiX family flavin prenyltransferase [Leptospira yasudae]TGM96218.1 UbiX family flavin prenyltransferase [Leptospira yasudae]
MKLVLGMAGASGSIYAERFIKALFTIEGTTFFICSPASLRVFREEMECKVSSPKEILDFIASKYKLQTSSQKFEIRNFSDIGADIASGSNPWKAMAILPCSMKTIASINAGLTENLIERAADVTLKERRTLVLVPREAPYNRIHLKNMLELHDAGGTILPASPGFYQMPKSLEDLGDFIAERVFRLLGMELDLYPRWNPRSSED